LRYSKSLNIDVPPVKHLKLLVFTINVRCVNNTRTVTVCWSSQNRFWSVAWRRGYRRYSNIVFSILLGR
jgi:hypothetical protein